MGDVWTWTAIDSDTKLVLSWLIGGRDSDYALEFMDDVAARLANRVQLSTDSLKAYLDAVDGAFGGAIDYAQLIKIYGNPSDEERRGKGSTTPAATAGVVPSVTWIRTKL